MAKQGHIRHILPSQKKPSHHFNVMLPDTIKRYNYKTQDNTGHKTQQIQHNIRQNIHEMIHQTIHHMMH